MSGHGIQVHIEFFRSSHRDTLLSDRNSDLVKNEIDDCPRVPDDETTSPNIIIQGVYMS